MKRLEDYWAEIEQRKLSLGLQDTPERTEMLRNKGGNRTPDKRELLKRAEQRARDAGLEPVKSYY